MKNQLKFCFQNDGQTGILISQKYSCPVSVSLVLFELNPSCREIITFNYRFCRVFVGFRFICDCLAVFLSSDLCECEVVESFSVKKLFALHQITFLVSLIQLWDSHIHCTNAHKKP